MPSSIYVNGVTTKRPGVYANVDASALGGTAFSSGNLAVVGDFPELETATPTRFNTANALKGSSPAYSTQVLSKLIYNPANDSRINGSPLSVTLVNGGTSTAATTTLDDGALLAPAMTITSELYGPLGNTGTVGVTAGSGNDRTVTITVNGTTRTVDYTGVDLFTLGYTGTDAETMTVSIGPSVTNMRITQSRTGIAAGALALATGSWKWDDEPTFIASAAVGTHSLSVSGIRKDTGAAFTSVLTFTASTTPDTPLGFEVSSITALTWTPDSTETLSVSGYAFNLDVTSDAFRLMQDIVDHINTYSPQGFAATVLSPTVGALESKHFDYTASTDIFNPATHNMTADLWGLIQAVDAQDIVSAAYFADPTVEKHDQIAAVSGVQTMAGGTFTTGDATSIANAYTACRVEDIQIFAHLYTDLASMQALRSHCQYMAGIGLGECNGWVGAPASSTKDAVKTLTAGLNTRHVGLAAQQIQTQDHTGATVWLDPVYQAVIFASMQVSSPVTTPLTRKIANVLDVRSHSTWDSDQDAEELLGYGLCFLTTDRLGFKVERSITTYQTDDNPVFSEVSANESLYSCIRDLRENLSTKIGEPGVQATAATIRALAKDRLRFQVDNELIKAFNGASLSVEDLGDTYRVNVEIAVVEPVNFIEISAKVTRIPFSA